jgi:hypothetical protein
MAKANNFDFPRISSSTTGMVFMGTPHRGTGKALQTQGQLYKAIVAANLDVEDSILLTLEEGNETLVDVVNEFTRLIHGQPPVKIFSFFEQKSTAVGAIVNDDSIRVCNTKPSLSNLVLINNRNLL